MTMVRIPLRVLILISVIVTTSGFITGQERHVRFQHLTIEDGLAQNMVDCILQDSQGFLWFGTWNGLCKYDGYNFEIFNYESHGINNFIHSLYEDDFGNIWVGTKEGLYVYLYDYHAFRQIKSFSSKFGENSIGTTNCIIRGWGNSTFIGLRDAVVEVEILDDQYIISILLDSDGQLWLETYGNGLNKFNRDSHSFPPLAQNKD